MRHLKKGRKFGRERDVRRAFLRALATALIEHERITTTEARAKELRPIVEKMITTAKKKTLASRRILAAHVSQKSAKKLFEVIAPRMDGKNGGYIRILKIAPRKSDSGRRAIIEFV